MTKMSFSRVRPWRGTGPFCLAVGLAASLRGAPGAHPHTPRGVARERVWAGIRGPLATHRARVHGERVVVAH